jgi:hypothetical protein
MMAPDALPYRLEWALGALALLAAVLMPREVLGVDLPLAWVVFWLVFPDLAFVAIGIGWKVAGGWPRWGSAVYNATHSLVAWAFAMVGWAALTGAIEWPMLAWAAHIAGDRALGYWLRETPAPPTP